MLNQTPAATRVDECTNELTGVGARMASRSQLIKGNLALLVSIIRKKSSPHQKLLNLLKAPKAIAKKRQTSPNREDTNVTIEARKLK